MANQAWFIHLNVLLCSLLWLLYLVRRIPRPTRSRNVEICGGSETVVPCMFGPGPASWRAALRVDLVLDGLAGARLEHADARHVAVLRAGQAAGDVAVDALLVDVDPPSAMRLSDVSLSFFRVRDCQNAANRIYNYGKAKWFGGL